MIRQHDQAAPAGVPGSTPSPSGIPATQVYNMDSSTIS